MFNQAYVDAAHSQIRDSRLRTSYSSVMTHGALYIHWMLNRTIEVWSEHAEDLKADPPTTENFINMLPGIAADDLGGMTCAAFRIWGINDWRTIGDILQFWAEDFVVPGFKDAHAFVLSENDSYNHFDREGLMEELEEAEEVAFQMTEIPGPEKTEKDDYS